jgi:IS605 OrfB family transposase
MKVTVEARVEGTSPVRVLAAVAALWGPLERLLFQRLHAGGNQPTAERIKEVKREFIARHRISARQFNGMRMNLQGKVEAWRETQKELQAQLTEGLQKLGRRLGRLETTRAALTRRIAAFKPSRKTPTPQALKVRRARIAFQVHQKKRRQGLLAARLRLVAARMAGTPSICFGGRAWFRKQFHLEANGFRSHAEWLQSWRERRSSQFYAVGSSDENRGNGECQFDPDQGVLRLRLPHALEARFGTHLVLPVDFSRPSDLLDALAKGQAISYRFLCRENGTWYVQATTYRAAQPLLTRRERGAIGADLNADHVAVAELDRFGNLAGHRTIPLDGRGLSTEQVQARIGDAVAGLVLQAKRAGKPLVIESLDFRKKKSALRELGKRAAGMLSSLVFAKFQAVAQSRCEREGVELLRVNPAYTSTLGFAKFGGYRISSHVAAAMAIGRRGLGFGELLKARTASPRLGAALQARLREIAKGRKAGEHVWKAWKELTPWLRAEMRMRLRPRSVPSGGASHPGRGSPQPVTIRSYGRYGARTPAVLAVGAAAPETGQTKGPIDWHLC